MVSTLKLALVPFLAISLAAAAPARVAPAEEPDIKAEIDTTLHWLRSAQDKQTGRYGDGLEATAWALRAFALSPRKYKRSDGPFVERALDFVAAAQREDGSIADRGAAADRALATTRLAAAALALYADPETQPVLARALAFLARQSSAEIEPGWNDLAVPLSAEAARALAVEVLAQREPYGSWSGERGPVIETARRIVLLVGILEVVQPPSKPPAEARPLPAAAHADQAAVDLAIERGARFLLPLASAGRFGPAGKPDPGLTAMALAALQAVSEPRPAEIQETIDQGLAWLVSLQKHDGSIHEGGLANYVTSAAILALARSEDPAHAPVVRRARDFLVELQADEGEDYSPDDPYYGGIGYGGDERPDLSNLQMALEALAASGLEKDNPAYARALRFLERCQNRSESNDVRIVDGAAAIVPGNDGGSAYAPGDSPAGFVELENGDKVPRSYGSMTYALLKSYIFAGVPKDDPRMKAAWKWLVRNYTLDVNPGFEAQKDPTAAYQGLFYYFLTMAKALDLYGEEAIVDSAGKEHPWRSELAGRLIAVQRKTDGSWVNENSPRWWEGNPLLATAYAMLALELTR